MKNGHYKVAKSYILYRETTKVRQEKTIEEIKGGKLTLSTDSDYETFDPAQIEKRLGLLSFRCSILIYRQFVVVL